MVREEVVRISRLAAFGGLTNVEVTLVLINYCLEHGKDAFKTQLFITYLLRTSLAMSYFKIALEFWEKKFTINKLYSKPQIGEVEGSRKILLID